MMRRRQDILFLGPALFRYQKERNEENMQFMIKAHDGDNMLENGWRSGRGIWKIWQR